MTHDGIKQANPWAALKGQIYLGDEKFVTHMQRYALDKAEIGEIPRAQRRPVAKALIHYQNKHKVRDEAMSQAYASGDYSMQEIALHFGVHYSTVSRAIQKISASDD